MQKAIMASWTNLEYLKNPSELAIKQALNQSGWAIKYVKSPSESLQLLAVSKNYDALRFIKEPSEPVQLAAIQHSYEALRYIKAPSAQAERLAILQNERALQWINDLTKAKILEFLAINFLVIKFVMKEISTDELQQVLQKELAKETVEEKYVRDFLNYSTIDKKSPIMAIDRLRLLDQYGSRTAKRIAVDEKLKLL